MKSRVTSATHEKGVVLAKKGGDKPGTNSKGKANSKATAVPDKKKKKGKTVVRSMQVMPASGAFEGSVSPRSRSRRVMMMGAQRRASVHAVNPEDLF